MVMLTVAVVDQCHFFVKTGFFKHVPLMGSQVAAPHIARDACVS